jgi:hypothetical protein
MPEGVTQSLGALARAGTSLWWLVVEAPARETLPGGPKAIGKRPPRTQYYSRPLVHRREPGVGES